MYRKRPAYLKIPIKKLAIIELHGCIEASQGTMYGKDEALYNRFHRRPLRNATIRALNRIVDEITDHTKTAIIERDIDAMLCGDPRDHTKVQPKPKPRTGDCGDAKENTKNVNKNILPPCCGPQTYDEVQLALADRFFTLYYKLVMAQVDDNEEEEEEEESGISFGVGTVTVGYPLANTLDKLTEHPLVSDSSQRPLDVKWGYIFTFDQKDQCKLLDYMLHTHHRDINNSFWYIVKMLVKAFSEKDKVPAPFQILTAEAQAIKLDASDKDSVEAISSLLWSSEKDSSNLKSQSGRNKASSQKGASDSSKSGNVKVSSQKKSGTNNRSTSSDEEEVLTYTRNVGL